MGKSDWSDKHYAMRSAVRVNAGYAGSSTTHTVDVAAGRAKSTLHEKLDPRLLNSPVGKFRESRDSAEHPNSHPIITVFDVTGSMRTVPAVLQQKLGGLMALITKKMYIPDPQLMFMANGDATCDEVPIQMGQFESGVEMDEDLDRFFLEGNGGGQNTESYELAAYAIARHTVSDAWEKRKKRGYAFFIGDERYYSHVKKAEVKKWFDDDLEADIPVEKIFNEVKERYETFFIIPSQASHGGEGWLKESWQKILGQNVLFLDSAENIAELIASTIGLNEAGLDMDDVGRDLKDTGASSSAVDAVGTALAPYIKAAGSKLGRASRIGTKLPEVAGADGGGAKRL